MQTSFVRKENVVLTHFTTDNSLDAPASEAPTIVDPLFRETRAFIAEFTHKSSVIVA